MVSLVYMKNQTQRLVELNGTFNTRDLGGYPTQQGSYVKWRKLFRSDDLYLLSEQDKKKLEKIGVNLIIDYRNEQERLKRPNKKINGAKSFILEPDDSIAALASADVHSDKKKIDQLIQQEHEGKLRIEKDQLLESMLGYVNNQHSQVIYSKALHLINNDPSNVVLQHCRGGKDRTGYGTALILLLLGVDEEVVIKDYLLTAHYNQERNDKRLKEYKQYTSNKAVLEYLNNAMGTREEVIRAAIQEMKKKSGSPLGYIQEYLDVSDAFIEKARTIFLAEK